MTVFLTCSQASMVKTKDKIHTAGKAKECLLFLLLGKNILQDLDNPDSW